MDRISRSTIFENDQYLLEKERYQGWISEAKVISLYTKHVSPDTLPKAWKKLFKKHLFGEKTSLDFIFEALVDIYEGRREEPVLIDEMTWDLRDITLDEVNLILKDDYDITV